MRHTMLVGMLKKLGCRPLENRYARYCYRVGQVAVAWAAEEPRTGRSSRAHVCEFRWAVDHRAATDDARRLDWHYATHPNRAYAVISDLLLITVSRDKRVARLYPDLRTKATFGGLRSGLKLCDKGRVGFTNVVLDANDLELVRRMLEAGEDGKTTEAGQNAFWDWMQ